MQRHNVIETVLGVFVILVVVVFVINSYDKSSHLDVGKHISVYAYFDKVDGVNIGDKVMLSGVKVGTVLSKSLEQKQGIYKALLTMAIKEEINLPKDSLLSIASTGLMGGKFVSISPGFSEEIIKNNDVITNTESSVSFEDMLKRALFSNSSNNSNNELDF